MSGTETASEALTLNVSRVLPSYDGNINRCKVADANFKNYVLLKAKVNDIYNVNDFKYSWSAPASINNGSITIIDTTGEYCLLSFTFTKSNTATPVYTLTCTATHKDDANINKIISPQVGFNNSKNNSVTNFPVMNTPTVVGYTVTITGENYTHISWHDDAILNQEPTPSATHIYNEDGIFTIAAYSSDGCRNQDEDEVVEISAALGINSDTDDNITVCQGGQKEVTYTATPEEDYGNAEDYNYEWAVPEGLVYTYENNVCVVTYTSAISSLVRCTATLKAEPYTVISTSKKTTVTTSSPSFSTCTDGLTVTIKDPSDISKYAWSEGDTNTNTSHTYSNMGTYTVTAMSSAGCTTTETVEVVESPFTRTPCLVPSYHDYGAVGYNGAKDGFEKTVGGNTSYIDSVMDYDGNIYPVVQIGSQCWLAENMRCTHSPKGYYLVNPQNKTGQQFSETDFWMTAHWWANDSINYNKFGLFYNWCAAVDTFDSNDGFYPTEKGGGNNNIPGWTPDDYNPTNRRGICPKGWHIPSTEEWNVLANHVGTANAGKLSRGCDWKKVDNPNNGAQPGNYSYSERNASGFGALPAGYLETGNNESSLSLTQYARFWSSTVLASSAAGYSKLNYNNINFNVISADNDNSNTFYFGYSVRCLRNEEAAELLISTGEYNHSLCEESSVSVTYTASVKVNGQTVTDGYTYSWNGGEPIANPDFTVNYSATGSYSVTCTAYKTGLDPIQQVNTITIAAGSYPVFSICENGLTVTVKECENTASLSWGDGTAPGLTLSHTYASEGEYNITATSNDGCNIIRTVKLGNSMLTPCTVANPHTNYSGGGYGNADDGKETVVDGKVNI